MKCYPTDVKTKPLATSRSLSGHAACSPGYDVAAVEMNQCTGNGREAGLLSVPLVIPLPHQ